MTKHMKHGPLLTHFYSPVPIAEFEAIDNFDDRTLSSLVGTADGGRPTLPGDGHDDDNPYRSLPLERWRDRGGPR